MFKHTYDGPPYNKNPISCVLKRTVNQKIQLMGWDTKSLETGLKEAKLRLTYAEDVVK